MKQVVATLILFVVIGSITKQVGSLAIIGIFLVLLVIFWKLFRT